MNMKVICASVVAAVMNSFCFHTVKSKLITPPSETQLQTTLIGQLLVNKQPVDLPDGNMGIKPRSKVKVRSWEVVEL